MVKLPPTRRRERWVANTRRAAVSIIRASPNRRRFSLIHWHPHIHALVSEGVFLTDGTFLPLPKVATEPFLQLWEQEVFRLLLAEGKITEQTGL